MKKTLLIGAAVAIGFSGFAQNNRQAMLQHSKVLVKQHKNDNGTFPVASTKKRSGPVRPAAACNNGVAFTSGPNAFGVGGGATTYKQNCLSYNKDLNSYVWTHRRSADWAATQTMSSGSIQSTYIKLATATWDSAIIYNDQGNTAAGRYPNGTFYNPAGNTNWANVWLVGTGPVLGAGAANFVGTWYATRHLTGTTADHTLPTAEQNYVYAPAAPFGNTTFMNQDIQQVGTKVMASGDLSDRAYASAPADFQAGTGGVIGIADFTSGSPVWSVDSIKPGYKFYGTAPRLGYAGQGAGRTCFYGNTGYWVDQGRLTTDYNNCSDSMIAPIVYKTTDGGLTWTGPLLPGYDWNCKHPELMRNVGDIYATKSKYWQLSYKHGVDVTCDANGVLHLVGTMCPQVGDGTAMDSAAVYALTYTHDYIDRHPLIWDLMTDGTDWKTMLVDSVKTSFLGSDAASDSTAAVNPMDDGNGGFLPYGARVQVARSTDGTKIFYSWADSDEGVTGTKFNTAPDLFLKGYDINSTLSTPSMNVTNGLGVCYFHMMADQAYQTGGKYICPMVYSIPRSTVAPGVYDCTSATDHYWVDCGVIDPADAVYGFVVPVEHYGAPSPGPCTRIGIQTQNAFANAVTNYPNPFSNSTNIVVTLGEAKAINVNVYDALGNLVFSKKVSGNVGSNTITVDGSALSSGVYHYSVTAGQEKVTKKMVVQK